MEFNPRRCRGAANKSHLVLFQRKENPVADDVAIVVAWSELFRPVEREIRKAIESEMGHQFDGVWSLDIEVHHVMREIEHDAALSPRPLLLTPVRVFGGDDGIDVGA